MMFQVDFESFLIGEGHSFRKEGFLYHFDSGMEIHLVPPNFPVENITPLAEKRIYLYEDRWYHDNEVIKKRVSANLGRFTTIFARNCEVQAVDNDTVKQFLNRYHSYGYARAKYKYVLKYKGEVVAAALFSAPRLFEREIDGIQYKLQSYEWVRYASKDDVRVVGGMGKLMNAFIKEHSPQEIMSYSDREWSNGDVYRRLGFREVEVRPAVEFLVDKGSYERISVKKIANDKRYKKFDNSLENYYRIKNLGSVKWLKIISLQK